LAEQYILNNKIAKNIDNQPFNLQLLV